MRTRLFGSDLNYWGREVPQTDLGGQVTPILLSPTHCPARGNAQGHGLEELAPSDSSPGTGTGNLERGSCHLELK